MKYRDAEIIRDLVSDKLKQRIVVTYNQWALGNQYRVYLNVDKPFKTLQEKVGVAFATVGEALNYAQLAKQNG